jgi:hypothetical protein
MLANQGTTVLKYMGYVLCNLFVFRNNSFMKQKFVWKGNSFSFIMMPLRAEFTVFAILTMLYEFCIQWDELKIQATKNEFFKTH